MEPYEEKIEEMFAVAKILGRLSVEGHITPDELLVMQTVLMKANPAPQPSLVFGTWGGDTLRPGPGLRLEPNGTANGFTFTNPGYRSDLTYLDAETYLKQINTL